MRREDIELRRAARNGHPQACLEIARRLFAGEPGFARNPTLGLAYLQQELAAGRPAALALVAREVPLEVIVAQRQHAALAHGVQEDCPVSHLKQGVLWAMRRESRGDALPLLRLSGLVQVALAPELLDDPERFAQALAPLPRERVDAGALAQLCAREALAQGDLHDACHAVRMAWRLQGVEAVAALAGEAVRQAAASGHRLELPVMLVEAALRTRSEEGDAEAQYALGCALAGLPYGHLQPAQIARQQCTTRATGWLLRAADAGKHAAWLDLFHITPHARAAVAGQDVARFFLEKAARAGLVDAQARLGTLLLAEATQLRAAEEAMHWLARAAEAGCAEAAQVMGTLVLPLPAMAAQHEERALREIDALDREIGMRVALARALHLTRHEALGLHPARDLRPWGLVLPGSSKENPKGRVAPAANAAMREALQRAREFWAPSAPADAALALHRSRAQRRIFTVLGLSEALFFAEDIGRSWTHYGYGRHWAARACGKAGALGELLRSHGARGALAQG